jgi:steroid 5-alpha reductase family enzyme
MESMIGLFAVNLAAVAVLMTIGWLVSLPGRNVTVVDSLWGLGFVVTAWVTFSLTDGYAGRRWLVTLLTTLWGLRLALHLSIRNWGKGEDPRYGKWRTASGGSFWWVSLFKVFWLQAFVLWVVALVVQVPQVASRPAQFTVFDGLGAAVWLVGFVFESVADWQLYRFKADPRSRGQVMDRGLWRYSRHPNYFGEFLIWWGLFGISLSVPGGWWTVVSPVLITLVLLKMTGVPLTESTTMERRPGYRDYMRRTPTFFPWFPRKDAP